MSITLENNNNLSALERYYSECQLSPLETLCESKNVTGSKMWLRAWSVNELNTEMERQLDLETQMKLGEQVIESLPEHFRCENEGRFVAVTFRGNVLALSNDLVELNEKLATLHLKENYYLSKLGSETITEID
jgi:hypothetical protein